MNTKLSKNILTYIFLFLCPFAMLPIICFGYNILDYQITYKIEQPPFPYDSCLTVRGNIDGNSKDIQFLRLPPMLNGIDLYAQGKPVSYERTEDHTLLKIPNSITKLDFEYTACQSNPTRDVSHPIIEKRFVHFLASHLLVSPENCRGKKVQINMDLSALPADLKVATSFNLEKNVFSLHVPMDDFLNSIIAAGEFKINKVMIKNSPVTIISNGEWPHFKKPQEYYIEKIIAQVRDFWGDNQFPNYTVFLVKQAEPVPRHFSAKHWYNTFSALMPDDEITVPIALYALTHEAFHAWVGYKMGVPLPQGELQWFIEGFNDYYGLSLAQESQVISLEDYIMIYNIFMKQYLFSPATTVSNDHIFKHFVDVEHYNLIAQFRGHFLLKQLRDKFNSAGQNKVDLAMKDLLVQHQETGQSHISEKLIDEVFTKHVGAIEWKKTKDYILSGKLIDFSPTAFAPFATLTEVEMDAPQYGFNMPKFMDENVIADVSTTSNAYKAGIRNGQLVKTHNVDFRSTDKMVTIVVEDNFQQKTIQFMPNIQKKMIPQYVLAKGNETAKQLNNRS